MVPVAGVSDKDDDNDHDENEDDVENEASFGKYFEYTGDTMTNEFRHEKRDVKRNRISEKVRTNWRYSNNNNNNNNNNVWQPACSNGGRCRPDLDAFSCDCPLGFAGADCRQTGAEIAGFHTPDFAGRSWLKFADAVVKQYVNQDVNDFFIRFKTRSPQGLLLWAGIYEGRSGRRRGNDDGGDGGGGKVGSQTPNALTHYEHVPVSGSPSIGTDGVAGGGDDAAYFGFQSAYWFENSTNRRASSSSLAAFRASSLRRKLRSENPDYLYLGLEGGHLR